MPNLFDEWQNSDVVIRIQDKNYPTEAAANYYTGYHNCGAFSKNIDHYYLEPIDTRVRIPAYYSRPKYITVIPDGFPVVESPQITGQRALGNATTIPNRNAEIMDYVPRLYVELTPVADFLDTIVKPAGCTTHYARDVIFATYDSPLYGMRYIPVDESKLRFTNQYVLTRFAIYTNKSDGTTQTELGSYNYNTWTSDGVTTYDMYSPMISRGSKSDMPYADKTVMIPYMQSFLSMHCELTTGDRLSGYHNYTIGAAGGLGASDGNIFSGINQIVSCVPGKEITPNPYLPSTSTSAGTADKKLTSYPTGEKYYYPIADMKTWKKIFTGSGMPWSFDLDDVKSPYGENLNFPTVPGQPNNPTGGGGGNGDNTEDDIDLPDVTFFPNSNSYNRYWLKSADLSRFQNWVFSETFFNNILRLWNDPAEYLINISFYPFNGYLHDVNHVTTTNISIGNIGSDIQAYQMSDGYNARFRGGTFTLSEYYGTYLDYAPYTSAEIYIPYIGYRQLNINDVMGKKLELIYAVDWDTNQLTATILTNDRPLTMFSAPFGVKLSLSGTNANQVAETISRGVANTVMSAGMAIANGAMGNVAGAVGYGMQAGGGALNTVLDVQVSPRQFGQPTPATGLYNTQIPHLIVHRPISAEPNDFAAMRGYSAGYSGLVSEFSGYLECSAVDIAATGTMSENEQTAIINLLNGGIYV